MSFLKKHLSLIVCVGIAIIALSVAGSAFLISHNHYVAYEKEFEKNAEEIKANFPSLPEEVFIDNGYVAYSNGEVASTKSKFKGSKIYSARDAVVLPLSNSKPQEYKKLDDDGNALSEYITSLDRMGGAITFTINTANYGMSDIEIGMRTNWVDKSGNYHEIENLTDKIKIQVNKLEVTTEEVGLPEDREGFQSLILQNTFLMRGENTITFTTSAYNDLDNKDDVLYIMPDIRNLTVLTDVTIVEAEAKQLIRYKIKAMSTGCRFFIT